VSFFGFCRDYRGEGVAVAMGKKVRPKLKCPFDGLDCEREGILEGACWGVELFGVLGNDKIVEQCPRFKPEKCLK